MANSNDSFCNEAGGNANIVIYKYPGIKLNQQLAMPNTEYTTAIFTSNSGILSTPLVCCIHQDTIVDKVGISISEIKDYPDNGFKKVLMSGWSDTFVEIKKNALGKNKPYNNTLLTSGHPIIVNGKEIKASKLVNNNTIVIKKLEKKVKVYTLMFNERKTIKMHGLDVVQWSENDFNNFLEKNNKIYTECGFRPKD